jgi:crotonobetainyl-CoA:carnitine CoA-transferase CaiB-like acyl-CoA transferase
LKAVRSIANPVRSEAQPILYRLPPPLLGEHNRQILGELRFPDSELEAILQEACFAPIASHPA